MRIARTLANGTNDEANDTYIWRMTDNAEWHMCDIRAHV